MSEGKIFWGDTHMNIHPEQMDSAEQVFVEATKHLDFMPVAYYPFIKYEVGKGMIMESCGQREEFSGQWETIKSLCSKYNEEGKFIAYPGYEWHGNRRKYGDHNVFYRNEGPLDASESLEELFGNLRKNEGIAIPHHTAYKVGERGKDWNYHDPQITPFAEIFSGHGSSEGCGTPLTLSRNGTMGPRVSGGSIQDGLKRGHIFGIIASGDNHDLFPGVWNAGLMAVIAEELSGEALWNAFLKRRVYAVSGDRIILDFRVNGHPMGDIISASENVNISATVKGSDAIDRIELLRNNELIYVENCLDAGKIDLKNEKKIRFKAKFEFGWGPRGLFGFKDVNKNWTGSLRVDGVIRSVETCFTTGAQQISRKSDSEYEWKLLTKPRVDEAKGDCQQALIFEIEASPDSDMRLEVDGESMLINMGKLFEETFIYAQLDASRKRIEKEFCVDIEEIEKQNASTFWNCAYKVKVHKAVPETACCASLDFIDKDTPSGRNWYYIRVTQKNGQMAWSSPVWVDA